MSNFPSPEPVRATPPVRGDRYLQGSFIICFLVLFAAAVLYLAFLDRAISFDEASLQNPPYMLLHYGRMTYPVHGHFDNIVVHPPTHYLRIALFMKLGLGLFHAAAVMPIVFFAMARMAFPVKFGLLFGMYLDAVVWTSTQTVPPDVSLALAWIAGLIGLETARLADWDPKRLFAGTGRRNSGNTTRVPGIVELTGLHSLGPLARAVKRGAAVDVSTAPKRWWDAASSPIKHTQRIDGGFIYVRGKVLKGVVGISIRGHDVLNILGSEAMWGVHDGVNVYIPIASFDDSDQVVIRNQRENGESEVLIEDIAVVIEKRSAIHVMSK